MKCAKCNMEAKGWKCAMCGHESEDHDHNHKHGDPASDRHHMPKCVGCDEAEVNCSC
jgi:hypothetical protein